MDTTTIANKSTVFEQLYFRAVMTDDSRLLRSHSVSKIPSSADDMSVSELAKIMKSQFASYKQSTVEEIRRMEYSLQTQMTQLRSDVSLDLEKIRKENQKATTDLLNTVEVNKSECLTAADRSMRANDLVVSGVPFITGESLANYFVTWCRSLGYAVEAVPLVEIKRLAKGTPMNGKVYMILIQFAITVQRDEFYARYLRSRKLSLTDIGFSSERRIFVNENLGPVARELRTKALQMKKKGEIFGVYTRMGVVYIKMTANDQGKPVSSEIDLQGLL